MKDQPNKQEPNPELFKHKDANNPNRETSNQNRDELGDEDNGKFKDRQKFLMMASNALNPNKDSKLGASSKVKMLKPKKK